LKDSILDPDSPDQAALVRNSKSERPRYRVFLYLEGPGLPYVAAVVYHLHSTFKEPTRQVFRTPSNPRCKLVIWTWGLFQVQATISNADGQVIGTLSHDLEYSKDFQSPEVKFVTA
jgi:transcription initiation factor IIF auxiliary subunit